jgi:hypothetical protein
MSNEDKNGLNNGNGSETNGDIPEIELIIKVIIVFNFNYKSIYIYFYYSIKGLTHSLIFSTLSERKYKYV